MKKYFYIIVFFCFILSIIVSSCNGAKKASNVTVSDQEKVAFNQVEGDTITISSDKTEYEITIIEPGFNAWLVSTARPEGYYSQSFLENRNNIYVTEWNIRVNQPFNFNPRLYELQINYDRNIDYGYEVNYKLFNYFIFFQRKYNQRLGSFIPRI